MKAAPQLKLSCGAGAFRLVRPFVLNQFLKRFLDVLAMWKDDIFDLRGIGDERVGGADAADRSVEIFEQLVRDAGGDLGPRNRMRSGPREQRLHARSLTGG